MSGREPSLGETLRGLDILPGSRNPGEQVTPLPIEVEPWRSSVRDHIGGTQHVYRFPNGYGASVVQGEGTYGHEGGLWELGVLLFDGDDHHLTYDTPVTGDVIGWLTPDDVAALLVKIAALP